MSSKPVNLMGLMQAQLTRELYRATYGNLLRQTWEAENAVNLRIKMLRHPLACELRIGSILIYGYANMLLAVRNERTAEVMLLKGNPGSARVKKEFNLTPDKLAAEVVKEVGIEELQRYTEVALHDQAIDSVLVQP